MCFCAEACFLTRDENEWYWEPISSKAAFNKDDFAASVTDWILIDSGSAFNLNLWVIQVRVYCVLGKRIDNVTLFIREIWSHKMDIIFSSIATLISVNRQWMALSEVSRLQSIALVSDRHNGLHSSTYNVNTCDEILNLGVDLPASVADWMTTPLI